MDEQLPTEAEVIIATLERLGLNALDNVQSLSKHLTATMKVAARNHDYKRAMHTLDGILECLANAMWIHEHYTGRGAPIGTYPSPNEALKRLHALKAQRGDK